jgi:hypothetical protein
VKGVSLLKSIAPSSGTASATADADSGVSSPFFTVVLQADKKAETRKTTATPRQNPRRDA